MAGIAAMVVGIGCGNSFDCTFKGKCADDVALTGADLTRCQSEISDPQCGDPLSAYGNCLVSNEQCDAAGNQDQAATNAACTSQQNAYTSCCDSHPDSGACPHAVP